MCLFANAGFSQTPYMVKDIGLGSTYSGPDKLTSFNGQLFFSADDGVKGRELWKSDGTETGTVMVKDIYPFSGESEPEEFTVVDGTLYFVADDGVHGRELWKTDGTEVGTVIVKDIYPGTESGLSNPGENLLTAVNGTLMFFAEDGVYGRELWKSDGTEAGTVLVQDIYAGNYGSVANARFALNVNGILFFHATSDDAFGWQLWKSDGTSIGTTKVTELWATSMWGDNPAVVIGETLYFIPNEYYFGYELWKSDGTEAGTMMVKDIRPTTADSWPTPRELTNINGTLFFSANDGVSGRELWKSDGTESGTVMVKDIFPLSIGSIEDEFGDFYLEEIANMAFFAADNGPDGLELWKTDGSESGTVRVSDIYSGGNGSNPEGIINVNDRVFFSATDGVNGRELWSSDGTNAGTIAHGDINSGSADAYPIRLTNVNGILFFVAYNEATGSELWALNTLTGVDETYNQTKVIAYPNPTTGSLQVKADEMHSYQVFDSVGKLIISERAVGAASVDISNQPSGIYTLQLQTTQGTITRKLVKN